MQKSPQIVFSGQVKQGTEVWKNGRVEFVVDEANGTWTVRLYHSVNPNHVVHQQQKLPLGKKAPILFKCNRLIIEALNIKVKETDAKNAQRLVSKITSYSVSTPTFNRAEVGLSNAENCMSGSKMKSQGLTPNGISSVSRPGWLSKTTPPSSMSSSNTTSSAKRKIQLDSPNGDSNHSSNVGFKRHSDWLSTGEYVFDNDDDDDIEDDEVSFPKFTGVKDYAKRPNKKRTNGLPNGLGTRSFYGTQNSLLADNAYRGLNYKTSPVNSAIPKSPRSKKAKLSELGDADQENKVVVSERSKALLKERMLGKAPTLSDPQEGDTVDGDNPGASHESSSHTSDIQAVGFDNLGNTCFMNSPLQCLSSLEPLSLDIQSVVSQFGRLLPSNSVTRMLYLLMKDVRKLDVRPDRVREILTRLRNDINSKFEYNTQQDAHELLSELLDRTDEEVKAVLAEKNEDKPNGVLSSTPTEANFTWLFKTSFYFHDCKTEVLSQLEEKDTTLMLPLDSRSLNLQDCVDKYFESTEVEMQCDKCDKREKATMTRKIIKRPRCFILNLLRYHSHEREAKKKLDSVTIPRYMSVVEYCAEDVKVAPAIGPVFMLDREELLLGLRRRNLEEEIGNVDSSADDGARVSQSERTSSQSGNINVKGDDCPQLSHFRNLHETRESDGRKSQVEGVYPPQMRSPLKIPHDLEGEPLVAQNYDRIGRFGAIGGSKPTGVCNAVPRKPVFPAGPLTPPTDEEDNVKDVNEQIVPRVGELTPCSSPKHPTENPDPMFNTYSSTPIIDSSITWSKDENGAAYRTGSVGDPKPVGSCEPFIIPTEELSPLHVDVNFSPSKMRIQGRKRNPAGDRGPSAFHNYSKEISKTETGERRIPLSRGGDSEHFPTTVDEVEIPTTGATQEQLESARVAAIEIARRGREVAREMAQRKEEERRHTHLPPVSSEPRDDDDPARWRIRQIANQLCDHFGEINEQLNLAQEAMEDMTDIYDKAQTIVTTVNKSLEQSSLRQAFEKYFQDKDLKDRSDEDRKQTELCLALLSKSIVEPESQDEDVDLYRLLKKMIAYRYKSVPGKTVQLNHFTHDLAMYLAAKEVGIIMVDSPKRRRMSSREEASEEGRVRHKSGSDHSYENKDRRRRRPSGSVCQEEVCMEEEDRGVKNTSGNVNRARTVRQGERSSGVSGTEGESESWSTEGTFGRRKPVRMRGVRRGAVSSDDEGVSGDGSKYGSVTQAGRRHSDSDFRDVDGDGVCDDLLRLAEEASSGAVADVSNNATMNTTGNRDHTTMGGESIDIGYMGCEGQSGEDHLHNRPISEWTEDELRQVSPEALTEEEVMVYVQALSKFEFIREQESHMKSASESFTTLEYTADLDLGPISEAEDNGLSAGFSCADGAEKVVREWVGHEEESTDFRHRIAAESHKPDFEDSLETMVGDLKDEDGAKSRDSHKDSSKKGGRSPELHCEETLSDIDEVDFGGDNEIKNTRLRSGQPLSDSSLSASDLRTGRSTGRRFAGRSCANCGQSVLRDRKVCSCKTPSPKKCASAADNGLVLSPSKSVINQRNQTSNSNSKSPTPSRKASPPRSGAKATPSQSPSTATVDKSKSTPVSMVSPRMDTLSQSKSARSDLARLRSPNSVSPRRRGVGKDPSTSSGRNTPSSASKRLNFEHEVDGLVENKERRIDMSPPKDTRLDDMSIDELGLLDRTLARSGAADFGDDGDFGDIPPLSPIKGSRSGAGAHCPQNSPLKSPAKSSLRGGCGDASLMEANNPVPVPVTGSPLNNSVNIKVESSTKEEARPRRVLPPTPLKSMEKDGSPNSKENVAKVECKGGQNDGNAVGPNTQEGACQDEKENVETLARKERLANIENGKADSSYRLVGIVNHHGESLVAGHYTAFSFNFNKQRWFFMDDKNARQTTETFAREQSANSGYVFFYMDKELFHQYAQIVAERRAPKEETPNAK